MRAFCRFSNHMIVRATSLRASPMHVASRRWNCRKFCSKGFRARVAKLSLMYRGPLG